MFVVVIGVVVTDGVLGGILVVFIVGVYCCYCYRSFRWSLLLLF